MGDEHLVVATAIVVRGDRYLIAKRSEEEENFPGLWTVPGGTLEKEDYVNRTKDTADHWYNIVENLLKREIREEVGLEVHDMRYLVSLSYLRSDETPTLILSFYCDYKSGEIELEDELVDYEWIVADELEDYKLVPGLKEEIELVDRELHEEGHNGWKGKYDNASDESVRDGV